MTEAALCRKLIVTSRLSGPEREELPGGRARFSVIRQLIAESLESESWFPSRVEPGRELGRRAVLESRDGGLWLHEQNEVGTGRLGPVQSREVASIDEAARLFMAVCHGWDPKIDGVAIDWQS